MGRIAVCLIASSCLLSAAAVAKGEESASKGQSEREAQLRSRGRFFSKIAVDRDYSGEWVIARTKRTTAFLDIMDRRHPRSRAAKGSDGPGIHILVVPNAQREHIAATLGAPITQADIQAVLAVYADAKRLARRLGIVKPSIYANSESRIGVGYFHVHIEGEMPGNRRLLRREK